jgi:hypothetical protein
VSIVPGIQKGSVDKKSSYFLLAKRFETTWKPDTRWDILLLYGFRCVRECQYLFTLRMISTTEALIISAHFCYILYNAGHSMAQAVSCCPLTVEARVHTQASLYRIYGRQSGTETGFSPSSSVFPTSISFHHSSILVYHRPIRCVIALTKQHIIISSALS